MGTDRNLLDKAKAAGAALAEAERQVLVSRGEYYSAIRRLHLGGAPLREIAQALSVSHQRVQQIVSAAGGSWWLLWRTRNRQLGAVCSWCDRPPSEVSKLIAGPSVFICDRCIAAGERALGGKALAGDSLRCAGARERQRCSFCSSRPDQERTLLIGPANVCSECLRTCREILDGRAA